jgi:hypothetical protein
MALLPIALSLMRDFGLSENIPRPLVEAISALCSDGWFALSVYGQNGYYDFPTVQFWRRIFKALWPILGPYTPRLHTRMQQSIRSGRWRTLCPHSGN